MPVRVEDLIADDMRRCTNAIDERILESWKLHPGGDIVINADMIPYGYIHRVCEAYEKAGWDVDIRNANERDADTLVVFSTRLN